MMQLNIRNIFALDGAEEGTSTYKLDNNSIWKELEEQLYTQI